MHVAVMYEGVLISSTGAPILDGIAHLRALSSVCRTTIVSETSAEEVERLCGVYSIENISKILSGTDRPEAFSEDEALVVRQARELSANESRLDSVVVSDPAVVIPLLQMRLSVSLFMPAKYVPPQYLPSDARNRASWAAIEKAAELRRPKI